MNISNKSVSRKPSVSAIGLLMGRDSFTVCLGDGRQIVIPYACFPRLDRATPQQRGHFEVRASGRLLHWPELDEDIEVRHLVDGRLPVKSPARSGMVAEQRESYRAVNP